MTTLDTEAPIFSGGGLTGFEVAEHEDPAVRERRARLTLRLRLHLRRTSRPSSSRRYEALVAELEDEGFDEAVESLVDEVAGTAPDRSRARRRPGAGGRAGRPGSGWSPSGTRSTEGWPSSSSGTPTAGWTPSARTRPPASWRSTHATRTRPASSSSAAW